MQTGSARNSACPGSSGRLGRGWGPFGDGCDVLSPCKLSRWAQPAASVAPPNCAAATEAQAALHVGASFIHRRYGHLRRQRLDVVIESPD